VYVILLNVSDMWRVQQVYSDVRIDTDVQTCRVSSLFKRHASYNHTHTHTASSKKFMNENFRNRRELRVTVTLTWNQSWQIIFHLDNSKKQSRGIPLVETALPALTLKVSADEREKHQVTRKKWRKTFTWGPENNRRLWRE
jgi:hypothetical protein